jgi:hypothetical protein
VSWVKRTRLAALTPKQKQRFLPLCPDFVIELCSPSDSIKTLQVPRPEATHPDQADCLPAAARRFPEAAKGGDQGR